MPQLLDAEPVIIQFKRVHDVTVCTLEAGPITVRGYAIKNADDAEDPFTGQVIAMERAFGQLHSKVKRVANMARRC
jgi:hypothetical protein